jgi:hypothetical protein
MKSALRIILFSAFAVSGCTTTGNIEDINWLIGHWQGLDANGLVFHEHWERAEKNAFVGSGATLKPDGDTLWKETLKIEVIEGVLFYVATVPGNKAPVHFKMVKGDSHNAVFENKEHDFPQRISYILETNNTVRVKLEGLEDGRPKQETLNFERVTDQAPLLQPQPRNEPAPGDTQAIRIQ